ncbi:MAG: Flp family type IVb pilin [Planctomycetota bacterium]|nr:Flp family type IVb pilin [Planctomycetota bacterium]
MFKKFIRDEKGAALLEYSLLAAGVALVSAAAVSVFGHKTNDMLGAVATVMPGAHADDNGPIVSAKIIETTQRVDGAIIIDTATIAAGGSRLGANYGLDAPGDFGGLVVEAAEEE